MKNHYPINKYNQMEHIQLTVFKGWVVVDKVSVYLSSLCGI